MTEIETSFAAGKLPLRSDFPFPFPEKLHTKIVTTVLGPIWAVLFPHTMSIESNGSLPSHTIMSQKHFRLQLSRLAVQSSHWVDTGLTSEKRNIDNSLAIMSLENWYPFPVYLVSDTQ